MTLAQLERVLPATGEMAQRVLAHDWAATPMGAVDGWPRELVDALALMLPAQAEIVLFWGPDYIAFYNDAYAPTIGNKHPRALGRPARESWAELWDDLEPLLAHVRDTGETFSAKDRPFEIDRSGYVERVYFDVSYSAVRVADGSVGGILCIVSETTERVRAANAVAQDRRWLHEMFDTAPGFMAVLRYPGHVFELANTAFERLVGGRPLIGLTVAEALPEMVGQGFVERLDDVAATGRPYTASGAVVEFQPADGSPPKRRVLDFVYQPITDATGAVTGVFVQGVDVTDREAALRELLLSRESLRLAADAAEIGTWDLDIAGDRLEWSARTSAHFGLPPDREVTLDDFYAGLHPDDRERVTAAFAAALDPDRRALFDVEYRTVAPDDGIVRWIGARGRALFDAAGQCFRAIGTTVDITAHHGEREALRESEARFRTLADSLPALVWLTDDHGRVLFANQGFAHLLGVSPDDMARDGWAPLLDARDRAALLRDVSDYMARPRPYGGDFRVTTPDGDARWLHGEARPRFAAGAFLGYVGCAVDVTEAHLAGERLESRVVARTVELSRQIEERERVEATLHQMQRLEAVGQLTSGVAHDFNNLLTVVLGNVDMLRRGGERAGWDDRALQRLEHVRQAAERGAKLTQQLLAFSRRQRLQAKAVDLNEAVTGMIELLGSTLGRSIAIDTVLEPSPWPALVDPTQIELIILNLAINARDAMPGGGELVVATANVVRGEPERAEEPPVGEYVAVTVTDTGTGMDPATLARAFEPFFTTKEVGKGSGLGLAQVFGFAKQSGGGVRIDTAAGEGTSVHVFLPRAAALAPRDVAGAAGPAAAPAHGRVLLVIDDEDAVRELTAETLREEGYRVVEAASGAAALRALAHEPRVDAVVADVLMPHMTGIEFARRAHRRWPRLPVLFVTGYADLEEIEGVPEDRIVRKPYARTTLIERLTAVMDADAT